MMFLRAVLITDTVSKKVEAHLCRKHVYVATVANWSSLCRHALGKQVLQNHGFFTQELSDMIKSVVWMSAVIGTQDFNR